MERIAGSLYRAACLAVIAVMVSALFAAVGVAADKMVLVGTEGVKNSMYGRFLTLVFTDAFQRLGYELQYDGYPAARASAMSDAGVVDGEISRVLEYQDAHPNLIRVEEVLYTTSFAAFAARPGIELNGWESLRNKPYKVDYRRGVKLSKSELSRVVAPGNVSEVTTAEQGLKKLIMGRADVYVDVAFTIAEAIRGLNPAEMDVALLYQAGVMQQVEVYAYLHKKHAVLVPKVVGVLKTMKQEGAFERYLELASAQL